MRLWGSCLEAALTGLRGSCLEAVLVWLKGGCPEFALAVLWGCQRLPVRLHGPVLLGGGPGDWLVRSAQALAPLEEGDGVVWGGMLGCVWGEGLWWGSGWQLQGLCWMGGQGDG